MKKQSEFPFGAVGHHIHAAHANTAPNGKSKRGDRCFCGRMFWALSYQGKEVWVTPEGFSTRLEKHNSNALKYRIKHREKLSKWQRENRRKDVQKARSKDREYYRKNALKKKLAKARARAKNPQKHKDIHRTWFLKNKDKVMFRMKKWRTERKQASAAFRVRCTLGARLAKAIRGKQKSSSLEDLTGCSFDFLKVWLESKWKPGMSWDNYGYKGWHIDHIRPCASFDLSDPQQQRICFHFLNLQPLWASENLSKGARMDASAFSRGAVIDYELKPS
jgi:hypothetical protein